MTPIEKAIALAVQAHDGQIDEDGMPHIVHCMAVMLAVKFELDNPEYDSSKAALAVYTLEELLTAAILHDTVEDSSTTLQTIEAEFGAKIAHVVDCVTRRGLGKGETKEFYRDFVYRCKADPGAAIVKWADLSHNRSRTHMIPEKKAKWREKLEYKYRIAATVISLGYTWEQASWQVTYDTDEAHTAHYFVADPNGKRIEISEAEFVKMKSAPVVS